MRPERYLKRLINPLIHTNRTKQIFHINPTVPPVREEAASIKLYVFDYDADTLNERELKNIEDTFVYRDNDKVSWINVDGLRKADVEKICKYFGVHNLLIEDILSIGQRPKTDEIDGIIYCLLNMIYFNEQYCSVEQEQISIVLGKTFVITFQEDASRDVFNPLRDKLKINGSKLRTSGADYLCYTLLDMIVDNYFVVMEALGEKIEQLEDEIIRYANTRSLAKINSLRKEMIVLKRNVSPVRDLVNNLVKSETTLVDEKNNKYFKDIYDHIVQANEMVESYRDMMMSLQDLYLSRVNLKLNEVMKVMAIVTCLLAPATVIGGIFGMNFSVIPFSHDHWGFHITVAVMFVIPAIMLVIFKRRGWF